MTLRLETLSASSLAPSDAALQDEAANSATTASSQDVVRSPVETLRQAIQLLAQRQSSEHPAPSPQEQRWIPGQLHASPTSTTPAQSGTGSLSGQTASSPASAMPWTDYSVYVTAAAGRRQGALGDAQLQLNAGVAQQLIAAASGGDPTRVLAFRPADLTQLAGLTGVRENLLTQPQLMAATRFVNDAADAARQQARLQGTLDSLQVLNAVDQPKLTAAEMKNQLMTMLGVPSKAFKKMSDAQIEAKYHEVMAALDSPGRHEMKIGKYKVKFTVDADGNVSDVSCKKKGWFSGLFSGIGNFFKKFGGIILTVCSFIPIPWIAIPARIISGVIAVVNAAKSKNVLGAVVGVASAVAGGAGALAGTALSAVAKTVGTVATTVAKVGTAAQAAANAVKAKDAGSLLGAVAGAAGAVAGGFANISEGVANAAQKVSDWSQRVLVGAKVVVDLKEGRVVDAVLNGASLAQGVAGEFKGSDGTLKPFAQQIADVTRQINTYGSYARNAVEVVGDLRRGDVGAALANSSALANGLQTQLGGSGDAQVTAGQVLGYAAQAWSAGSAFVRGDIATGITQTTTLFDDVKPLVDPNASWSVSVDRWLQTSGKVVDAVDQVRTGGVETLFDTLPGVVNALSWNLSDIGVLRTPDDASQPNATHPVAARITPWIGHAASGWSVGEQIFAGEYTAAFDAGLALANDVVGTVSPGADGIDPNAGWAKAARRVIEHAPDAIEIGRDLGKGKVDAALDRAANVALQVSTDIDDPNAARIVRDASRWLGHGAEAWRIAGEVKAGRYEPAVLAALDLSLEVSGTGDAGTIRARYAPVIEAGFDVGEAIADRDTGRTLVSAATLVDALLKSFARPKEAVPA